MKALMLTIMTGLFMLNNAAQATGTYTLRNSKLTATFISYGARLTSLTVPDKHGKPINVTWGFDNEDAYRNCKTDPYYGAIIGRYGNRIAGAQFSLARRKYKLEKNDHGNSLHGGFNGFHDRDWKVESQSASAITFSYLSEDGEAGYPGNLHVSVTYSLAPNGLKINYEATTDKPTVINLTNHAFWNLNGTGSGTIVHHILKIRAGHFTPVNNQLIPTGKIEPVAGTPLDFRKSKAIGIRIDDHDEQLRNGKGYDHNYVLDLHKKNVAVAEVSSVQSGIRMEVFTDQPGLQFYSGNFMAGKNIMAGGARDNYRNGFCLETQHFPDSPNQPAFPSAVLKAGQVFQSTTTYQFSLLSDAPAGAN